MLNAVQVCMIVAIFCSALILVGYFNGEVYTKVNQTVHIINKNEVDLKQYLLDSSSQQNDDDYSLSNIKSDIIIKPWGLYDYVVAKTYLPNDTILKANIIGKNVESTSMALYLTDYGEQFKYSGQVRIDGKMHLPSGRMKKVFLKNTETYLTHKGAIDTSKAKLPRLAREFSINLQNSSEIYWDQVEDEGTLINSFAYNPVIVIFDRPTIIEKVILKGNIVLSSRYPIILDPTALIEDVIIESPELIINNNFKGAIQAIIDNNITIGEDVTLSFPSGLQVKNEQDSVAVRIGQRSRINGHILVESKTRQSSLYRTLTIAENSIVRGDIYCSGVLDLKGTVHGSVYADFLTHDTPGSNSSNLIVNAEIYSDSLPKMYPRLEISDFNTTKGWHVIKEL